MKKILLGLSVLVLSMGAQAQQFSSTSNGFSSNPSSALSVGASLAIWNYDEQTLPTFTPYSLEVVASYPLHKNFDIQANAGIGISDDTNSVAELNGTVLDANFKVKNYMGIYLKPNVDIGYHSIYALVGYARTKMEANLAGQSVTASENGFSYGFGGSFALTQSTSITAEWRRQVDTSLYNLDGFTLGFTYKFK